MCQHVSCNSTLRHNLECVFVFCYNMPNQQYTEDAHFYCGYIRKRKITEFFQLCWHFCWESRSKSTVIVKTVLHIFRNILLESRNPQKNSEWISFIWHFDQYIFSPYCRFWKFTYMYFLFEYRYCGKCCLCFGITCSFLALNLICWHVESNFLFLIIY